MINQLQIPIYRAKKIDSEKYIVGNLFEYDKNYVIIEEFAKCYTDDGSSIDFCYDAFVDPSTLSIHFTNMIALDSDRLLPNGEKDLRVFASLSKDGKGGDIFIIGDERLEYLKYIAMIKDNQLMGKQYVAVGSFIGQGYARVNQWKVIGIQ